MRWPARALRCAPCCLCHKRLRQLPAACRLLPTEAACRGVQRRAAIAICHMHQRWVGGEEGPQRPQVAPGGGAVDHC